MSAGPGVHLKIRWLGPGLIMAVSGIGASDVISATVGGARHGTTLLWALLLGAFFKFVLTEGLARWQLATGTTIVEGWARHLPRSVLLIFFTYLILWSVSVGGALLSGCGLAIENITRGRVSFAWGAVAQALMVFAFIFLARGERFAAIMKPLIAIMFASVVVCAALTFPDPAELGRGLFLPTIPPAGGPYVLSLIGGIGGSLTLLSYSYLLREAAPDHPANLGRVRLDLALAYLFTAVFGLSIMLIAARVFHGAGIAISDRDAVSGMAGQLAAQVGPAGFYVYSIGFWAAVLASLLGVWQTVPHIFADCWSLLRNAAPQTDRAVEKARACKAARIFMLLTALPFAFLRRPLLLVVGFTIVGSLFIPFLAATLLQLNNRIPRNPQIRGNSLPTNIVLCFVLVLFVALGALEIYRLL